FLRGDDPPVREIDHSRPHVVAVRHIEIESLYGLLAATGFGNEDATLLKTISARRWLVCSNGQIPTRLVGKPARTVVAAPVFLVWYEATSISPFLTDTARGRVDRMRRSVEEPIKIIPPQCMDETVAEWVMVDLTQMEFAKVSAIVAASFQ